MELFNRLFGSLLVFCIPLFRQGCHQRVLVWVVATGAVVVLLSERAWHRADYEGGLVPEDPGISTMGGVLCPQPYHSY